MTVYLGVKQVCAIHFELIERYGGSHGIRDYTALEAAVLRPQSGYYGDLLGEAAALMESLAMNHPFIDGNKRAAFMATDIFLRGNGMEIDSSSVDAYNWINQMIESRQFTQKEIYRWLEKVAISAP